VSEAPVLTTDRLILRRWRASDRERFANINADSRVMHGHVSLKLGKNTLCVRVEVDAREDSWTLAWVARRKVGSAGDRRAAQRLISSWRPAWTRTVSTTNIVIVHRTQIVFEHRGPDSSSEIRARLLVAFKMYPAVNARVRDVVGNLPKRGILQNDGGHRWIRQSNGMSSFAVESPQDLGRAVACTAVV
jgi:hypothetical protein